MEPSESLDRAVSSARLDVQRDQQQVSHDVTHDPALQANLARDEQRLNRLERKEEISRSIEQSQGFGF